MLGSTCGTFSHMLSRGDARVAPPGPACPTTSCVWRSLPLTLPYAYRALSVFIYLFTAARHTRHETRPDQLSGLCLSSPVRGARGQPSLSPPRRRRRAAIAPSHECAAPSSRAALAARPALARSGCGSRAAQRLGCVARAAHLGGAAGAQVGGEGAGERDEQHDERRRGGVLQRVRRDRVPREDIGGAACGKGPRKVRERSE